MILIFILNKHIDIIYLLNFEKYDSISITLSLICTTSYKDVLNDK